jgi:hypothetical protein
MLQLFSNFIFQIVLIISTYLAKCEREIFKKSMFSYILSLVFIPTTSKVNEKRLYLVLKNEVELHDFLHFCTFNSF